MPVYVLGVFYAHVATETYIGINQSIKNSPNVHIHRSAHVYIYIYYTVQVLLPCSCTAIVFYAFDKPRVLFR
eukprot:SAG11_NODE_20631_length_441_cov_1.163743_1_plen_71_part_10